MRDLKFRAWIKPLKRYAMGYELVNYHQQCNMKPSWWVNVSPEEYYYGKDVIIEQDTGFEDKNGKRICEGDIVKVNDSEHVATEDNFLGDNAEVKISMYYGGAFTVKNWYGERLLNRDISLDRIEVIGNIHENKELLK